MPKDTPRPIQPDTGGAHVVRRMMRDAATYAKKAADYAPDPARPFVNFEFASEFAARVCLDLAADDPRRAVVTLMGVKLSRLMTLGLAGDAKNEAVTDTLRDLRVYAAILEEIHDAGCRFCPPA